MFIQAVAFLTTLAFATGVQGQASSAPVAQVVFPETTHAFGNVAQGVTLSHTFVVRNAGTTPLKIEGIDLQAPGMKTSFKPVLSAGEAGRITIDWNTSAAEGQTEVKAVVRLSDPQRPKVELALTATVTRSIEILPMPAVFFSVYTGDTATRSVTIVNRESRPLEITGLEPAGDHFEATITPLKPGQVYRLDVTVPRTAPPGRFMESVSISTNHPNFPRLHVAVNVLVKHELYVNPEALDFGTINIAQLTSKPEFIKMLTQKLIVRKRAGDFAVTAVSSDVAALQVTVTSKERAEAFQIEVSVLKERLAPGPLKGVIRIETDDKNFPVLQVPVSGVVR